MRKQIWMALMALAALLAACSDDETKKPDMTTMPDKAVTTDVGADTTIADQSQADQAADQALADQTLDLAPDKGPTGDGGAACGKITVTGCCDGTTLKYCEKGVLKVMSCSSSPSCGWDKSFSYYDCGTAGGSDPSGKYPKSCSATPPDLGPTPDTGLTDAKVADSGGSTACGGVSYEGCCDGKVLKYCDSGTLKTIDCASSPKCGWDSSLSLYDCGTSGGSDPSGKYPIACKGSSDGGVKDTGPTPDAGVSDAKAADAKAADAGGSTACGSVSYEGCCDGTTLKYCDSGKLETLDCTASPKCGWDSSAKYYDCGTAGGSDPSGKSPKACKGSADGGGVKDSGPTPDGKAADTGTPADGSTAVTGVVITEMMINPKAQTDSKAEWFELYNAGTASVSLKGWSITDQAGSSQNKHTITANVLIKPGAYVVLGKYYDKTATGGVTVNYAYGQSVWDLGNGGDEIYLYDAAKKLVDKVAYTKTWTIPNGASLSLKDPTLDNSLSKNWCVEKTKWCSTCDMGTPGKKASCK